jgi:copper chaperone CopZ
MKKLLFILFLGVTSTVMLNGCGSDDTTEENVVHTKACTIEITGMMCEKGCKTTIQNRINEMEGVVSGEVDYALGKAFVTYNSNELSCNDIIAEIESIGDGLYEATMVEDKDVENAPVNIEGDENATSASVSSYSFEVPDITWFFSELL